MHMKENQFLHYVFGIKPKQKFVSDAELRMSADEKVSLLGKCTNIHCLLSVEIY